MFFNKPVCFIMSLPPYFTADFIKGFHGPTNDMERINASLATWGKLLDAFGDPFGSVSCNNLDAR